MKLYSMLLWSIKLLGGVSNKRYSDLGNDLGKEVEPSLLKQLQLPAFSSDLEKVGRTILASNDTPTTTSQFNNLNKIEVASLFILDEALPVVPTKLVKQILRGEYIDMAELLKDNIEVERRRLTSTEEGGGSSSGARRGIPNLWSWLQCYSLYAAIMCSKYPVKAREMWVYQATIIGEAKQCKGNG